MRFFKYLHEEYVSRVQGTRYGGDAEVFVDPDNKEIKDLGRDVRFIIDFRKKHLYVWKAHEAIHWTIADYLYNKGMLSIKPISDSVLRGNFLSTCLAGFAGVDGNKLVFQSPCEGYYGGNYYQKIGWLKWDDKWLNKWFNAPFNKTFIEKYGPGTDD